MKQSKTVIQVGEGLRRNFFSFDFSSTSSVFCPGLWALFVTANAVGSWLADCDAALTCDGPLGQLMVLEL